MDNRIYLINSLLINVALWPLEVKEIKSEVLFYGRTITSEKIFEPFYIKSSLLLRIRKSNSFVVDTAILAIFPIRSIETQRFRKLLPPSGTLGPNDLKNHILAVEAHVNLASGLHFRFLPVRDRV